MADLPDELIAQVQKYTGRPWWNGQAYAEFVGWPQKVTRMKVNTLFAIDQIEAVRDSLRAAKDWANADRLRDAISLLRKEMDGNP